MTLAVLLCACGNSGDDVAVPREKVIVKAEPAKRKPVTLTPPHSRPESDAGLDVVVEPDVNVGPGEETEEQPSGDYLPDFAAVYEKVAPSVVKVLVYDHRFYQPGQPEPLYWGTGFFCGRKGEILTNAHVVEGGLAFSVELWDGRTAFAELVGADPFTDVAMLRIAIDDPPAPLARAPAHSMRIGMWLMAIGNPLGLEFSATKGIVSGLNRTNASWDELGYWDFIQTDAAINLGNSGGPLLDAGGRVVGICTAMREEAERIGFAIPLAIAEVVVEHLRRYGMLRRARLGIQVAEEGGEVVVVGLYPDSPAQAAGFDLGDVILELDGTRVEDVAKLRWEITVHDLDAPAVFKIVRGDQVAFVEADLEEAPGVAGLALRR